MADFVAPQFQSPDLLGSYLRGQMGGIQSAMAPGALALQHQEVQGGQLNLDMLRQMMQFKQQAMNEALGSQPTQTGQSPGGPTGGVQNGPQGAVSQPSALDTIGNPSRLSADARMDRLTALMSGKSLLEVDKNAAGAEEAQRTNMIARAKLQFEAPGSIPSILKAFSNLSPDAAAAALDNNPQLKAQYAGFAKQNGFDSWDKSKIPLVAALEYNKAGAQLGMSVPVPKQYKTVQQGLGQSYQVEEGGAEPGKISGGASALPTEKYVVNGQVVERTKAQGISQGLQPYDSALYGADQISDKALEQAYQTSKQTGDLTQSLAGRDAIASAKISSFIAKRAQEDGITGVAMAAQKQTYAAQQAVLKDYTDPSGKAGGKLQSINTVTEHAQALYPLIDALGTGNSQLINKAALAYQQQTGSPAPTSYKMLSGIFGQEVINAITQNGGDKDEREELVSPLKDSNSSAQLKDAIKTAATAMAGKTHALQQGWDVAMKNTQGPFDQFLTPSTKQFLGGDTAKAPVSKTIGGKTYVQQNGKWYQQ